MVKTFYRLNSKSSILSTVFYMKNYLMHGTRCMLLETFKWLLHRNRTNSQWYRIDWFQSHTKVPQICIQLTRMASCIRIKHLMQQSESFRLVYSVHWKKGWSHFDLKSWVTGGTKIRQEIPSNLRIFESIWLDIESQVINLTHILSNYLKSLVEL